MKKWKNMARSRSRWILYYLGIRVMKNNWEDWRVYKSFSSDTLNIFSSIPYSLNFLLKNIIKWSSENLFKVRVYGLFAMEPKYSQFSWIRNIIFSTYQYSFFSRITAYFEFWYYRMFYTHTFIFHTDNTELFYFSLLLP